jgi:hypothetical protein
MNNRIYAKFLFLAFLLLFPLGCTTSAPVPDVPSDINNSETQSTPSNTVESTTVEPSLPGTPNNTESPSINGSLETVEGIPILRIWGSLYEMGYAYGYLYSSQIVSLYYTWFDQDPSYSPTYEDLAGLMEKYVVWSEESLEEARGCLAGIEASLGSLPVIEHKQIEAGSKQLDLEMLLVLNSIASIANIDQGCSSFAAWGKATGDGLTRAGGNNDWPDRKTAKNYILLIRKPDHGLGTACIQVAGSLLGGCAGPLKGMNETGLVLATQGVLPVPFKATEAGYTHILLRNILEQVSSGPDMVKQVTQILEDNKSFFTGFLLFTQKGFTTNNLSDDQMSAVIEKDPYGFAVRLPSHNSLYNTPLPQVIFGTNHFLLKQVPAEYQVLQDSYVRYQKMVEIASNNVITGLPEMQKVLQAASGTGSIHSIYFEPDTMTIHLGYGTENGLPSPYVTPVTFTWDNLFGPIPD